ncbi:MAG: hypothetical protein MJ056_01070 [Akkermansia sp.]|nr:hypothetical protein [Akkermansia sp.]
MAKGKRRDSWSSGLTVVLAVAGSAVGFGNFLRFPGLAAQYGGGAFMIAYFCAFVFMGLALSWMEWSLGRCGGRLGGHSCASIFTLLSDYAHKWKYLGVFGVVAPLGIGMYYMDLEGWTLGYAWHTALGDLNLETPEQFGDFFTRFTGADADGNIFLKESSLIIFFLLALFANFYLLYRGVVKGIEWFCKWSMPILLLIAIAILVRVLTLGTPDPAYPERSVEQGLGYMWNPDKVVLVTDDGKGGTKTLDMVPANSTPEQTKAFIEKVQKANPGVSVRAESIDIWHGLLNPSLWVAAAGQIFWTLSIGFGVILCYSSYVDPKKDIALSSLTANAANEAVEVGLAGLMIIPAAVSFLGVAAAAGASTFGLGFNVLPQVFAAMPLGQLFGTVFFLLLFVAAITSSISLVQPSIAFIEEYWGIPRVQSVAIVNFLIFVGALMVAWFSGDGMVALSTLDFWMGTMSLYIITALYFIMFRWVIGTDRGIEELQRGALIRIPTGLLKFVINWSAPCILGVIFVSWLYDNIFNEVCQPVRDLLELKAGAVLPMLWVVITTVFCCLVVHTSKRFRNKTLPGEPTERKPRS